MIAPINTQRKSTHTNTHKYTQNHRTFMSDFDPTPTQIEEMKAQTTKRANEGRYSEQSKLEIRAFMAETIENDCIFGLFSERDRLEVAEAKSLEFMRANCHYESFSDLRSKLERFHGMHLFSEL